MILSMAHRFPSEITINAEEERGIPLKNGVAKFSEEWLKMSFFNGHYKTEIMGINVGLRNGDFIRPKNYERLLAFAFLSAAMRKIPGKIKCIISDAAGNGAFSFHIENDHYWILRCEQTTKDNGIYNIRIKRTIIGQEKGKFFDVGRIKANINMLPIAKIDIESYGHICPQTEEDIHIGIVPMEETGDMIRRIMNSLIGLADTITGINITTGK